jgi:hypothetical protein
MIYSSVLSLELLQKATIAPIKVQEQIAQMLDSITCTTLPPDIHKWYNDGPEGRSLYCLNLNCRVPPGRFFWLDLTVGGGMFDLIPM